MSDVAAPPEGEAPAFGVDDFARAMSATPAQVADLQVFLGLLTEWSARMNLVGPTALPDFWLRHAYDSAQLFHVEQSVLKWADIGAGAGFPGLVLAILLKDREKAQVHLVESRAKRIQFLEAVCLALNLPATLHHARAEDIRSPPGLEVITARACAPLPRLLGYTEHLFEAGARGVFLKGRDAESELTQARQSWKFQSQLLPSQSDPSGWIVKIERLARA
jgi:16S rRNA (guanine527-N7)-methyltransferase